MNIAFFEKHKCTLFIPFKNYWKLRIRKTMRIVEEQLKTEYFVKTVLSVAECCFGDYSATDMLG